MDTFPQNEAMVDTATPHRRPKRVPNVKDFETFSAWLTALCNQEWGTQKAIADITGTTPQAVTRWLKGGGVTADKLKRLARWLDLNYSDLRMLADGHKDIEASGPRDDFKYAEMSAEEMGKRWAQLPPEARLFILALMAGIDHMMKEAPASTARWMDSIRSSVGSPLGKPARKRNGVRAQRPR